ncbi:MAG: CPBP family intramembrane metalloprotease [Ruminiclostridium sp.]|nr:CPBP family intramembrane metalloprotease [Ruminiclostridium sp.]
MKENIKKFFKVFIYLIVFSSLYLIMQTVVTFPYTFFYMFFKAGAKTLSGDPNALLSVNPQEAIQSILMPVLLSSIIMTFGIAWLIHALFRKNFFERLYFNKTNVSLAVISFVAGLSLQIPINDIISFVEKAGIMPDAMQKYSEMMESIMSGQSFFLEILLTGILVPIIEEIMYRGLVFDQLRKNLPLSLALIIQALIFGVIHLNMVQGTYAFMIGLLLGIALIRSRSIILPIAIHMGTNLSGVLLSKFQNEISSTAEMIMRIFSYVLVPVCIALIFIITINKPHITSNKTKTTEEIA